MLATRRRLVGRGVARQRARVAIAWRCARRAGGRSAEAIAARREMAVWSKSNGYKLTKPRTGGLVCVAAHAALPLPSSTPAARLPTASLGFGGGAAALGGVACRYLISWRSLCTVTHRPALRAAAGAEGRAAGEHP